MTEQFFNELSIEQVKDVNHGLEWARISSPESKERVWAFIQANIEGDDELACAMRFAQLGMTHIELLAYKISKSN